MRQENNEKNTHAYAMQKILAQLEPFLLVDIINEMKEDGISNEAVILKAINRAYEIGWINYKKIKDDQNGNEEWAFVVI